MKLLLLEDDLDLCIEIEKRLTSSGYMIDVCNDGESGMYYALSKEFSYDAAIIDRMLPIVDGLTIVRAMREKNINIPIIITTGMSALNDRIDGLDGGADDYLVKPFYMEELLARIRAITRRPADIQSPDKLIYADLCLDRENRTLSTAKKTLILTARENELLSTFMIQPNVVFSRERLIMKIWGTDSDIESGNVDNYISFLRKRLKELGSCCKIKTIYGAGYRLDHENA